MGNQAGQPELHNMCVCFAGASTLMLHHKDYRIIIRAQPLRNTWQRSGEGLIKGSRVLTDGVHTCSDQVVIPPSILFLCRIKTLCTPNRKCGRLQMCLTWILQGGVQLAPKTGLPTTRQRIESHLHTLWRVSFSPIWPQKLVITPTISAPQCYLSWEVGGHSWSSPEQYQDQA